MNHQNSHRPRLLYVVTSAAAVGLLRGQLAAFTRAGFDVFVAAEAGPGLARAVMAEGATPLEVPLAREPAPAADLRALIALYREIRRIRPCLTNVGTPKAGLLGGLAAWFAGVPCRVYTLRGLRWETARGLKRCILLAAE